jgi:hypothetical protein
MSRNEDRMGAPDVSEGQSPAPVAKAAGAQMEWATQTELVSLPSKGAHYREPHPLAGKSSVEIRFMTAKEEDILTSKSLLKSGKALNRLVESLVIDKRIKAGGLLVGDRNAILISARQTGYGDEYEVNMTCPACGTTNKTEYSISRIRKIKEPDLESANVTVNHETGYHLLQLPKSKVMVEFKLLTADDEVNAARKKEQKEKHRLAETLSTDLLRSILVSVNGSGNVADINKAVEMMPAIDARHLRKIYKMVNPDIVLEDYFVCESCGHNDDLEIPLSAEFFWPE